MKIENNKLVILLTACVTPGGMSFTYLQNPKERERQYLQALQWYLINTQYKIILCENTNYSLPSSFNEYLNSNRLEYLSFDGNNNFDKQKGKGVGEANIIDYALNNSRFIDNETLIVKITGRLIIKNVNQLIASMKNHQAVYGWRVRHEKAGMQCVSYFFSAPKCFYQNYFLSAKKLIDDSKYIYFETILYQEILRWKNDMNVFNELYLPILVIGESGSNGGLYKRERLPYLKTLLKFIIRRTLWYKVN